MKLGDTLNSSSYPIYTLNIYNVHFFVLLHSQIFHYPFKRIQKLDPKQDSIAFDEQSKRLRWNFRCFISLPFYTSSLSNGNLKLRSFRIDPTHRHQQVNFSSYKILIGTQGRVLKSSSAGVMTLAAWSLQCFHEYPTTLPFSSYSLSFSP